MKLLLRLGVLVSCVWLMIGCSRYASPSISVADARVVERTPEGVVVEFTLDAVNTNEVELPLKSINYALSLDGRRVFSGARAPEATLRRFGTQQVRLPAAFAADAAASGEVSYRLEGRVRYLTPGELADVLFDARVYRPSVAFRDTGTIDFSAPVAGPYEGGTDRAPLDDAERIGVSLAGAEGDAGE